MATATQTPHQPAPPTYPIRPLPVEEWPRLLTQEPFRSGGLPDPTFWRIIVAERDQTGGPIVAFVCLWTAIHCEPVWFDPTVRHHPKLFQGLWEAAQTTVAAAGGSMVFATIDDDDPGLQDLWQRFGFIRAPGRLYVKEIDT